MVVPILNEFGAEVASIEAPDALIPKMGSQVTFHEKDAKGTIVQHRGGYAIRVNDSNLARLGLR